MLQPNETAKEAWRVSLLPIDAAGSILSTFDGDSKAEQPSTGFFVATNRRFVFLEEKGLFTKTYNVMVSVDHSQVRGTGTYGGFLKSLMLSVDYQGRTQRLRFSGFREVDSYTMKPLGLVKIEEMIPLLDKIVKNAMIERENERRKERIQYVLDFSFLKAEMEKGGIVVQTIKCPSCNASVQLPETGTVFKCQYCGNAILAQDLFQKMKGLIGGL
jgi:DNA-directed RNA polymerase subunit RPC12/RpoP